MDDLFRTGWLVNAHRKQADKPHMKRVSDRNNETIKREFTAQADEPPKRAGVYPK